MSAKTPICDKNIHIYLLHGEGHPPRVSEPVVLADLARALEAHCEAMSAYPTGHSSACTCGVCGYLAWKREQLGRDG